MRYSIHDIISSLAIYNYIYTISTYSTHYSIVIFCLNLPATVQCHRGFFQRYFILFFQNGFAWSTTNEGSVAKLGCM